MIQAWSVVDENDARAAGKEYAPPDIGMVKVTDDDGNEFFIEINGEGRLEVYHSGKNARRMHLVPKAGNVFFVECHR